MTTQVLKKQSVIAASTAANTPYVVTPLSNIGINNQQNIQKIEYNLDVTLSGSVGAAGKGRLLIWAGTSANFPLSTPTALLPAGTAYFKDSLVALNLDLGGKSFNYSNSSLQGEIKPNFSLPGGNNMLNLGFVHDVSNTNQPVLIGLSGVIVVTYIPYVSPTAYINT